VKPNAIILRSAGTNCDLETATALELAGFAVCPIHINRLLEDASPLTSAQLLAIPGGFSYGDDIAAGRILANRISRHLRQPLADFVAAGKPIIGICNGFQVLIKTDILPGPLAGHAGQICTLTNNDCGHFVDRWIRVAPRSRKCIWTVGLPAIDLPVAHGEGKLVPLNDQVRQALWDNDQVALIYARPRSDSNEPDQPANGNPPYNPNGSIDDIAGICDPTGLVLGLMPHPERHISPLHHPAAWSKNPRALDQNSATTAGAGLTLFRNAFAHIQAALPATF
jgi:phosphoribosylformylglycinamidine synthase subunit PurQ / glutaminase